MKGLRERLQARFPSMIDDDRDWLCGLVAEAEADSWHEGRDEGYAEIRRNPESFDLPPLHMPELLRELAEDRHEFGAGDPDHTGTLRTCADRLCDAAATLLGRG